MFSVGVGFQRKSLPNRKKTTLKSPQLKEENVNQALLNVSDILCD